MVCTGCTRYNKGPAKLDAMKIVFKQHKEMEEFFSGGFVAKSGADVEEVEAPATTATEGEEPEAAETEKSIPGYTASLLVITGLLADAVRRMR